VASGRRRVNDEVQHGEGVSRESTTPSIASSEEEKGRLESSGGAELRVIDGELDSLQVKSNQGHEEGRQRK
jgi:hypothetical protein